MPLPRCHVAKSPSAPGMEVSLGLNVRAVAAQFGEYVTFTVSVPEESSTLAADDPPRRTNAFALLVAGAQAAAAPSHLPEAKG